MTPPGVGKESCKRGISLVRAFASRSEMADQLKSGRIHGSQTPTIFGLALEMKDRDQNLRRQWQTLSTRIPEPGKKIQSENSPPGAQAILNVHIPQREEQDVAICPDSKGRFSVKTAYHADQAHRSLILQGPPSLLDLRILQLLSPSQQTMSKPQNNQCSSKRATGVSVADFKSLPRYRRSFLSTYSTSVPSIVWLTWIPHLYPIPTGPVPNGS